MHSASWHIEHVSNRQDLIECTTTSNCNLAHQNRTIAIASDSRVDGRNPAERRGFGLRHRSPKSQIASDFASHPYIAMQHCFLLSRKSLRFLGSTMGIAIANRKNRCDFGALRIASSQLLAVLGMSLVLT